MLVNRGPEKGLAEDSAHRKRSDGLDLKFDKWICANGSVQSATNLSAESINTFWGGKRFGPPIPHHEFSTVPGVTLLHYNYQCVFITQERLLPKYEYSLWRRVHTDIQHTLASSTLTLSVMLRRLLERS